MFWVLSFVCCVIYHIFIIIFQWSMWEPWRNEREANQTEKTLFDFRRVKTTRCMHWLSTDRISRTVSHFPFCRETEAVPPAPKRQCGGGRVAAGLAHGGGGGGDAEDGGAAAAEDAADARPGPQPQWWGHKKSKMRAETDAIKYELLRNKGYSILLAFQMLL